MKVAVLGAGLMGSGIAQVAATATCTVILYDTNQEALDRSKNELTKVMDRLITKGRLSNAEANQIQTRIQYTTELSQLNESELVIEAIVENLDIKKTVFRELEALVDSDCIIASNTSSLSIASIASALQTPSRCIGIHFFNPAPLMKLVEIIPAIQTSGAVLTKVNTIISNWGKQTVIAKDTPGFIVNKVARPFYSEALRIYEEGVADIATIDWAMTQLGGFKMGPFTLMDFIGNDINYTVTESIFKSFYYDPRYKPAFTQKRLSEAGYLGRKSGRGYYDYSTNSNQPEVDKNKELGEQIVSRILMMLINEAADTLHMNIATKEDIDLAMTQGVNYPKGLFQWADEIGIKDCVEAIDALYDYYHEDRYRCSPVLRRMAKYNELFYTN